MINNKNKIFYSIEKHNILKKYRKNTAPQPPFGRP